MTLLKGFTSAAQAIHLDMTFASLRTRAGLTRRETDVVELLARGLTNREIAAALVVTEGTAENYVHRLLGKLCFNNRTQVAAWAVESGLGRAPDLSIGYGGSASV
jgi:DNA-binding NarL/FixJ family response regulator